MNESKAIKFLRVSYWVGAIFDALVLVPMLSPKIASVAFGIPRLTWMILLGIFLVRAKTNAAQ